MNFVVLVIIGLMTVCISGQDQPSVEYINVCEVFGGYFQDQSSCRCFYQCDTEYRLWHICCPEGQAYDEKNNVCVPQNLVVCESSQSMVSSRHSPSSSCYLPNGLFRHEDCSKFWHCSYRHLYEMSCPEGFLWNDMLKTCVLPQYSTCNSLNSMQTNAINQMLKIANFITVPNDQQSKQFIAPQAPIDASTVPTDEQIRQEFDEQMNQAIENNKWLSSVTYVTLDPSGKIIYGITKISKFSLDRIPANETSSERSELILNGEEEREEDDNRNEKEDEDKEDEDKEEEEKEEEEKEEEEESDNRDENNSNEALGWGENTTLQSIQYDAQNSTLAFIESTQPSDDSELLNNSTTESPENTIDLSIESDNISTQTSETQSSDTTTRSYNDINTEALNIASNDSENRTTQPINEDNSNTTVSLESDDYFTDGSVNVTNPEKEVVEGEHFISSESTANPKESETENLNETFDETKLSTTTINSDENQETSTSTESTTDITKESKTTEILYETTTELPEVSKSEIDVNTQNDGTDSPLSSTDNQNLELSTESNTNTDLDNNEHRTENDEILSTTTTTAPEITTEYTESPIQSVTQTNEVSNFSITEFDDRIEELTTELPEQKVVTEDDNYEPEVNKPTESDQSSETTTQTTQESNETTVSSEGNEELTTTESPNITTESSDATTESPDITTESTDTTTESTDTTTESTDTTTESPDITTESTNTTTESPDITTESTNTTTESPDITTESPDTTTESPETTTDSLISESSASVTAEPDLKHNETVVTTLLPGNDYKLPKPDREICKEVGGYYPDISSGCKCFFICDFSYSPFRQCCPEGLLYNENAEDLLCDYPDRVNCGLASDKPVRRRRSLPYKNRAANV